MLDTARSLETGAMCGDALELLRSLPRGSAAVVIFDPQHRDVLNALAFGNEGERQVERCKLPAMTNAYINDCLIAAALALRPGGHCFLWVDTYRLCKGRHLAVEGVLPVVDLLSWDNQRIGMGYRSRRRGDYLLVMQTPPTRAKGVWTDHGIPDRWVEKVDRKIHPHIKPAGLIKRLIGAVTEPSDLVVDPAAGSFLVMNIAHELGRRFAGCDIVYAGASRPTERSS